MVRDRATQASGIGMSTEQQTLDQSTPRMLLVFDDRQLEKNRIGFLTAVIFQERAA